MIKSTKLILSHVLVGTVFLFLSIDLVLADSAKQIMEKVDENVRARNESVFTLLKLSTCKYGISENKIKCSKTPTIKQIESISINTGPDGKDSKSIAFIQDPPSERGIGMLSYNYDDTNKDNETWLYLSAFGKIKRIVSSNSDAEAEPVAIFGSEFTNEDQESGKINDYDYKLLKETTYKNKRVAIINQIPKPHKAKKSRYGKSIVWIDLDKYIVLKAKMYNRKDTEIRRLFVNEIDKINNIWLAKSITILNLETQRLSNMKLLSINFGVNIDSGLFSKRSLTDKAFRQGHLKGIRDQTS